MKIIIQWENLSNLWKYGRLVLMPINTTISLAMTLTFWLTAVILSLHIQYDLWQSISCSPADRYCDVSWGSPCHAALLSSSVKVSWQWVLCPLHHCHQLSDHSVGHLSWDDCAISRISLFNSNLLPYSQLFCCCHQTIDSSASWLLVAGSLSPPCWAAYHSRLQPRPTYVILFPFQMHNSTLTENYIWDWDF